MVRAVVFSEQAYGALVSVPQGPQLCPGPVRRYSKRTLAMPELSSPTLGSVSSAVAVSATVPYSGAAGTVRATSGTSLSTTVLRMLS